MHNLVEVIQALDEDQQHEVFEFIQTLTQRGAARPKTRLRQDWAGMLEAYSEGKTSLELQRLMFTEE